MIDSVQRVNDTAVRFSSNNGVSVKEIQVWNGNAYVLLKNGAKVAVCESDVSCSALTVEDEADAEALEAEARDALVAAGFEAATRRNLAESCEPAALPDMAWALADPGASCQLTCAARSDGNVLCDMSHP